MQILPLANGDEVVEVMLIPSKPSKEEIVVLVTAAGLMTKLPLERLTEQIGEADNMKPFKCITLQVSTQQLSAAADAAHDQQMYMGGLTAQCARCLSHR